ncbi:tartrate-resistant acid phosphatase type 5-like [Saccoglossus kowalevskii]|uniref:Tartrate-resistant acid phosphatase type 5 n=1 Tax=Saccoglossus kowalevskii TaxID=10224 RepID=A0ABM0GIH2_SACKO|nr:PREDICTED: tartrate-resistant acid phosphatase type 5-like [Saccoglossus kowalevskii]
MAVCPVVMEAVTFFKTYIRKNTMYTKPSLLPILVFSVTCICVLQAGPIQDSTLQKDGMCPVVYMFSNEACEKACRHDFDCEDKKKCCSNGCGQLCKDPLFTDTNELSVTGTDYKVISASQNSMPYNESNTTETIYGANQVYDDSYDDDKDAWKYILYAVVCIIIIALMIFALSKGHYELASELFKCLCDTTYEDIFTAASLHRPWYVCAGNHDHIGNISAQLAYTKFSDRWNYPDLYYTKRFSIPNSESTLLIVFIDTVILTGNTDDHTPDSILPGPEDPLKADAQWKWIEDTLSNSKDDYVIVGGHYPVWSIAEHGPNNLLVAKLKPLLEKYNVTAYFCGHDHNMQHFKEDNSSVEYFVIGAGDVVDPSTKHKDDVPPRSLRYHWADVLGLGAFAYVEATKDSLSVAYYEALNGKNIYTRVLTSRHK